jgi:hypothetical protein
VYRAGLKSAGFATDESHLDRHEAVSRAVVPSFREFVDHVISRIGQVADGSS